MKKKTTVQTAGEAKKNANTNTSARALELRQEADDLLDEVNEANEAIKEALDLVAFLLAKAQVATMSEDETEIGLTISSEEVYNLNDILAERIELSEEEDEAPTAEEITELAKKTLRGLIHTEYTTANARKAIEHYIKEWHKCLNPVQTESTIKWMKRLFEYHYDEPYEFVGVYDYHEYYGDEPEHELDVLASEAEGQEEDVTYFLQEYRECLEKALVKCIKVLDKNETATDDDIRELYDLTKEIDEAYINIRGAKQETEDAKRRFALRLDDMMESVESGLYD